MADITIENCYYGGDQMPWAEYAIVGDLIFLSGAEGRDMSEEAGVPGQEEAHPSLPYRRGRRAAQTKACLSKIAERTIKAGASRLENIFRHQLLRHRPSRLARSLERPAMKFWV